MLVPSLQFLLQLTLKAADYCPSHRRDITRGNALLLLSFVRERLSESLSRVWRFTFLSVGIYIFSHIFLPTFSTRNRFPCHLLLADEIVVVR